MTLAADDFNNMQYLLGKANAQGLTPQEEFQLRNYIGQEDPASKDKALKDLITIGLIIVGFYLFLKAFEK